MSTIATSGLCMPTCRRRSSAFPDCATTSKPASASSRAIPSRSRTVSSASTTVIRLPASRWCCGGEESRVGGRRPAAGGCARARVRPSSRCSPRSRLGMPSTHRQRLRRDDDLAAVSGVRDARGSDDVDARVALVRRGRGARRGGRSAREPACRSGHSASRSARCAVEAPRRRPRVRPRRRRRTRRRPRPTLVPAVGGDARRGEGAGAAITAAA